MILVLKKKFSDNLRSNKYNAESVEFARPVRKTAAKEEAEVRLSWHWYKRLYRT